MLIVHWIGDCSRIWRQGFDQSEAEATASMVQLIVTSKSDRFT